MTIDLADLKYDEQGLIPAVIQDAHNKKVLMLAYMNQESLGKTLATGKTWFFSRSRQKLWNKGETSGHFQYVKSISYDCDADTLLIQVDQVGVACHTGANSCFFNELPLSGTLETPEVQVQEKAVNANDSTLLGQLAELIKQRKVEKPEGSYTTYLFNKGEDKILKKVGEETAEILIAAKGGNREEIIYETGDLLYHLLVMLAQYDIDLSEVWAELAKRH